MRTSLIAPEGTTLAVSFDSSRRHWTLEVAAAYGDTASAMGKSLDDMVEAVADAATGEFERLKEFGIRASKNGDRVSFTRTSPRPRIHYLECPKCESCFKVPKDVTSVPAHKCWAEEKERAKAQAGEDGSRPLERLEQVRAFLASDLDDPAPARWPCVVTFEEAAALRRAVAAQGGGLFGGDFAHLPIAYTGPAFDLEARKREVSGAPVLGEWAGTLLVGEP